MDANKASPSRPPAWRAIRQLEENLGHTFRQPELLTTAVTHSSWANEQAHNKEHNERLEFLGDAVLELCVSKELFMRFPKEREGMLTEMRSRLVSEENLAKLAKQCSIQSALRLGNGEEAQAGRNKDSLLADALEAVFAAVFLDGGLPAATNVINRLFENDWPSAPLAPKEKDPKSQLQEICQKIFSHAPLYELISASGPPHDREFAIRLRLPNGKSFEAAGRNQKKAEQEAAAKALCELKNNL